MIKKIIFSCLISFSFCANSQYNVTGVPYFYQYSNSINPGGSCQNTSIAMLLKYYGASNLTPDWISNQYGTSQAQTVSGSNTVCNSVAQSKGLATNCISTSSGSFQGMNALLAQGKPMVVHGYFTSYGHVMVVTGFTGTHYICNDPAGKWTQVHQGGYLSSTSTVGNQIQYGKAAFEQAIGPDNTLWYHYYNAPACSTPTGLTTQEITSSSAKIKWLQVGSAGSNSIVLSNILSDYKSLFRRENLASSGIASSSSGTQSYYRPNMRLKFGALNAGMGKQTEEQKDIELETQVLESKMLYVYPNPMTANTKLQFITDLKSEIGINLSIYDEFGRILYRAENYLLDPFENSINMDSELNQGVYFLNIKSENICLTERFQVIK